MKKLQVFDLDDTILRIPTFAAISPADSIKIYNGDPYQFYDSPESLDCSKYNIQLIEPVYEKYLQAKDDAHQVLITHRVGDLMEQLFFILGAVDIDFNQVSMLGRKSKKANVVNKILEQYSTIEEIEIFEDSLVQIDEYQRGLNLKPGQKLTFWFVDKSKIFKLGNIIISEEERINLKTL
jgi:predicted RNA-binding protein